MGKMLWNPSIVFRFLNEVPVQTSSCAVPPGTYGTVFKAKDRESGEIVALKVVRLDEDDEVRVQLS